MCRQLAQFRSRPNISILCMHMKENPVVKNPEFRIPYFEIYTIKIMILTKPSFAESNEQSYKYKSTGVSA